MVEIYFIGKTMKYFKIDEFLKTSTGLDNKPNKEELNNILNLMLFMDAVRESWTLICNKNNWGSGAIVVNSGFRSEAVNNAVGGSPTSEHRLGFACDIEPKNGRNKEFFEFMVQYLKDKNFSQLINEKPDKNNVPSWIHFSLNGLKGFRRQILTVW